MLLRRARGTDGEGLQRTAVAEGKLFLFGPSPDGLQQRQDNGIIGRFPCDSFAGFQVLAFQFSIPPSVHSIYRQQSDTGTRAITLPKWFLVFFQENERLKLTQTRAEAVAVWILDCEWDFGTEDESFAAAASSERRSRFTDGHGSQGRLYTSAESRATDSRSPSDARG